MRLNEKICCLGCIWQILLASALQHHCDGVCRETLGHHPAVILPPYNHLHPEPNLRSLHAPALTWPLACDWVCAMHLGMSGSERST